MGINRLIGTCNLDTTCCPVAVPTEGQRVYYCVKCKRHVLKYEVGVHLLSGEIVWVFGGFPGTAPDIEIAQVQFTRHLIHGEQVFADKGYRGCGAFLVPFGGRQDRLPPHKAAWNHLHTQMHFEHIERVNRRLKIWQIWCLKTAWRHGLAQHKLAFYVIAKVTNVELQFHPLNYQ